MNVCIILQCKYTTLYRFWYNFVLHMCMLMILINWIYVNKSFICLLYGILET